jgi:hypothetical protein
LAAAHGEADQKALKALSSLVEEEFKIASERETITIAMREASLRVTTARQAEAQAAAEAEAKLKQDIYKELYAQAKQADELAEDFLFTAQNMKMLIDKLHQIDFHAAPITKKLSRRGSKKLAFVSCAHDSVASLDPCASGVRLRGSLQDSSALRLQNTSLSGPSGSHKAVTFITNNTNRGYGGTYYGRECPRFC